MQGTLWINWQTSTVAPEPSLWLCWAIPEDDEGDEDDSEPDTILEL